MRFSPSARPICHDYYFKWICDGTDDTLFNIVKNVHGHWCFVTVCLTLIPYLHASVQSGGQLKTHNNKEIMWHTLETYY